MDADSITLNQVKRAWSKINEEAQTLLIKFDRSKIQNTLSAGAENTPSLSIRGKLNNGADFQGTNTITIVRKGNRG